MGITQDIKALVAAVKAWVKSGMGCGEHSKALVVLFEEQKSVIASQQPKEDEQADAQDEGMEEENEQDEDGASSVTAHDKEKSEVEDATPEQLTQRHKQF